MPKSKSTRRPKAPANLPPYTVLERRLEEQYDQILRVHSICYLATNAAERAEDWGGFEASDLLALRCSLEALGDILERVKSAIHYEEMLRTVDRAEVAQESGARVART